MTYPPSQDPWNASADTEHPADYAPSRKPRRRRVGTVIAVAAAALIVAIGGGIVLAATSHRPGSTNDAEGRKACEVASNWNKSMPGHVDATIVEAVHSHSVRSNRTELVVRGDALYDTWALVSMQQVAGDLTPGERDLRALAPLMAFRTACVQAGYPQ